MTMMMTTIVQCSYYLNSQKYYSQDKRQICQQDRQPCQRTMRVFSQEENARRQIYYYHSKCERRNPPGNIPEIFCQIGGQNTPKSLIKYQVNEDHQVA